MDTQAIEPKTSSKTKYLVPGWKQAGPGRPKSRVRERAGRVYDAILQEFEGQIERHMAACESKRTKCQYDREDILSTSELAKIASEVKTIGMGELKDVSLDKEQYLEALQATLSEMNDRLSYEQAEAVLNGTIARLKDV